jgi:glucan phosphoethanolaminetransferase (alkaline phosphatase superfamily)
VDGSRLRRLGGAASAALFALQFGVLDLVFHGARRIVAEPRVVVSMVESSLVWTMILLLLRARSARVVASLAVAFLVVVQAFVFRYYHVPLDVQVAESALHAWRDVRPLVEASMVRVLCATLALAAVELVLVEVAHRSGVLPRLERRAGTALLGMAVLAGVFGPPPRRATPEVRALHALTALGSRRETERSGAVALPSLYSDREELPNVLFILTESVRETDYVTSGPEATAPATTAALPDRVTLRQMRAISSYTALSLSALLTGRSQEAKREDIAAAPTLFDLARAARDGRGRRPFVAYYGAHSREVFETKEARAAVDRFVSVEDLLGREVDDEKVLDGVPLDRMIVDRLVADLPNLPRPLVVVLHLYCTHAPYFFEDARARFVPFTHVAGWSELSKLRNAYKNAIFEQDQEVARAVSAFTAAGGSSLIAFTSDHGEAFGEHAAIHHGQNLYDEQVHVPAWIAARDVLDANQAAALATNATAFTTHLDLLPTLLDAMGLWDNSAVQPYRKRMVGASLLRPLPPRQPIFVTNCTSMFRCPLNTWGVFDGDRKLVAQAWDGDWLCLELSGGERPAPPGDPACARLKEESRRAFPMLPNGAPNR